MEAKSVNKLSPITPPKVEDDFDVAGLITEALNNKTSSTSGNHVSGLPTSHAHRNSELLKAVGNITSQQGSGNNPESCSVLCFVGTTLIVTTVGV